MEPSLTLDNRSFFEGLEDIIREGKSVQFRLKGRSMEPFIQDGSQIRVSPVKFEDTRLGDVVLARWRGNWILHRILFKNKDFMYLIGDGNLVQIEKVGRNDLVATLTSVQEKDGKITSQDFGAKVLALVWFLARPLRLVVSKIKNLMRS